MLILEPLDAVLILKSGEKNLHKASNNINKTSSRGHAVLSIKIIEKSSNNSISQ